MKKIASLLCLSILFITACKKLPENQVSISTRNFGEIVQLEQNLVISFNQDLVDVSMIGDWDSSTYINFDPPVEGKFKWVSTQELVFSPEIGFAPSTNYKATISDEILSLATNEKLYLGDELKEVIEFHTPYLEAKELTGFWSKTQGSNAIGISANLKFNYPVDAGKLASLLVVMLDDKEVNFKIESTGLQKEINLTAEAGGMGEDDVMVKVKIKKGLSMEGSSYTTSEDQDLAVVLPSRLRLEIIDISSTYSNGEGIITVLLSQELLNTDLSGTYTISPNVSLEATALNNGFELKGNFDITSVYTLTILTKLEGALGGRLKENYKKNISFSELPPEISFTNSKALYLSSAGAKNIGVKIINVPKVKVRIYKIYENNILAYLRHNSYSYWDYDYDDYEDYGRTRRYREDYNGVYSDMVSEQTIETANIPTINGQKALNIQIPEQNKSYKGIYFIKVSSADELYLNATKLVSMSDVGIMAKRMENKVLVFAHSILTAKALSDVEISLISSNNQVMKTAKSGTDGVLVFDNLDKEAPGFKPAMITVKSGSDFNFVPFSETGVETSRFDVGGKYSHQSGFDAYIYAPRNLYRPGEGVDFNTIIRDQKWNPVSEVPVKLKLVAPNGREFKSIKGKTNKQGAIEAHFDIPSSALTGSYNFEVYNGNDIQLSSYRLNIEEFMPDRMRLLPEIPKTEFKPGEKVVFKTSAMNFFGPPAANRNYEVSMRMTRRNFYSKKYPSFNFYIPNKHSFETVVRNGRTDDAGVLTEKFDIPNHLRYTGIVDIDIYATVFDETGRPVHAKKDATIMTQNAFFGIHLDDYYVGTNKPMKVALIALDKNDKLVKGARAKVEIVRYEYHSVLENVNGYHRWRSRKIDKQVYNKVLTFGGGKQEITYNPLISGSYEVRVYDLNSENYVSYHFYAYGWGSTTSSSFEVNTEGQIDISLDKEKYDVGDKVKALIKSPFAGKLLVSVERDNVLEYKVLETDQRSAEFEFTVKEEHLPNVYINATLIRPMGSSAIPLTVAHGIVPVIVEKKSSVLPLEIEMVSKSRSKTKQKIKVKSKPESDIEVTLAIVDEGILQIKNFQTPDPHAHFYQKRALEVNSYDIYAFLFPELNSQMSSGGDADFKAGGEKRANPLANKRVKLLAKWSGILKTNSQGIAEYELDIPQFNGEVRVMAVAYKDKSFGATSKPMTIADPMVINTALPRFLSPLDELDLPVNLANTTGKSTQAKVSVQVEGPLEIIGSSTESAAVMANKEQMVGLKIKALANIGEAKVKVKVEALGEVFTEELDITVRPSAALTRYSTTGLANHNSEISLTGFNDFMPASRKAEIMISSSPLVEFMEDLSSLIRYPHGCLEQTTSKAFPQIYLSTFFKNHHNYFKNFHHYQSPDYNVEAAINKISSMQLYNGSYSYWAGGRQAVSWASVYATHFLIEAKKAGFDVSQGVIDRSISYLKYELRNKKEELIWIRRNGEYVRESYADRAQIYALYVLAIAGEPDRSLMNYYKSSKIKMSSDSKYMLAASFALIGDEKGFKTLLPSGFAMDEKQQTGGYYGSNTRSLAISLNALVETDPNNSQIPSMLRQLTTLLKGSRYHNTQEMAFSLLAIGKITKNEKTKTPNALVKNGDKIIGRFDGKNDMTVSVKNLTESTLKLELSGEGSVYYYVESSGISSTGKFLEEDSYLKARRYYYDRNGKTIDLNNIKQNDLIVVQLNVTGSYGFSIDNVAVTDMLPAGFEIENPRLNELPGVTWSKPSGRVDNSDFRDDRANFYTTVYGNGSVNIYYMVRAVSKGTFQLGPVSADAMYNGEYHSYHGGGTVTIR